MFILQIFLKDETSNIIEYVVLEAYYIFFTFFMLGAAFRNKTLMDNCGFLKSILPKSLFYAFLSSMAFGDVLFWSCDVVGSIFAILVVLNFLRYCGDGEEPDYEAIPANAETASAAVNAAK
jgi:hypothetical protein